MRCSHRLPARRRVPPLPRLPDRRGGRRVALQRRRAGRSGARTCQDIENRQQDTLHQRNSLRENHIVAHRLYIESRRKRENQGAQGRRQYRRQGGNTGTPRPRSLVGQDAGRPLCLYGLRSEHLAQLLRHRGQEAAFPLGRHGAPQVGRPHPRALAPRTGNPARRDPGDPALCLAGENLHRRAHLQRPRLRASRKHGRRLCPHRRAAHPVLPPNGARSDQG